MYTRTLTGLVKRKRESMDKLWRGWDSMRSSERIVAMSLVAGCVLGIVNSTIWAAATCYINYQRERVKLAEVEARVYERLPADRTGGMDLAQEDL